MTEILVATIATFGVSALISTYDGSFGVLRRLRSRVKVFECTVCTAVWIAVPIANFTGIGPIGYLFIIGGVILLERFS